MVVATYVYLRSLWEEAGIETFIVGIWGPEAPRSAKTSTFNHSFCADTTCGHDVRHDNRGEI